MQSFDPCMKIPKFVLSRANPPSTPPSHLKLIWKPYLFKCNQTCNRPMGDGIQGASHIFGGTYLSKFKWVLD
jgi:hypothetical protein